VDGFRPIQEVASAKRISNVDGKRGDPDLGVFRDQGERLLLVVDRASDAQTLPRNVDADHQAELYISEGK
jgi:hypothetical protein